MYNQLINKSKLKLRILNKAIYQKPQNMFCPECLDWVLWEVAVSQEEVVPNLGSCLLDDLLHDTLRKLQETSENQNTLRLIYTVLKHYYTWCQDMWNIAFIFLTTRDSKMQFALTVTSRYQGNTLMLFILLNIYFRKLGKGEGETLC